MEERLLALEHRMEAVEIRLGRVEDKLDRLAEALADIRVELAKKPSTAALWGMVATMLAIALAIAGDDLRRRRLCEPHGGHVAAG